MTVAQIVMAHGFHVETLSPGQFKVMNMVYYPATGQYVPETLTRQEDGSLHVLSESGSECHYPNIFQYLGYDYQS